MSLPIRLLPEATDELTAAIDWYKKTQRIGLGSRFIGAVRYATLSSESRPIPSCTVSFIKM